MLSPSLLIALIALAVVVMIGLRALPPLLEARHRLRVEAEESRLRIEQLTVERERLRADRHQSRSKEGEERRSPDEVEKVLTRIQVPSPEPPTELVRNLAAGEGVLFAGAGLAHPGGSHALSDLLLAIVNSAEDELAGRERQEVQEAMAAEERSVAVDLVRSLLGKEQFEETLHNKIPDAQQVDGAVFRSLAELPFSSAVTVDWSGVVGSALLPHGGLTVTPPFVDRAIDAFRDGEYFLLEAAGDIWNPPVWPGVEEMRDLVVVDREFARFMVSLLNTRSFLFLGSDLDGLEEFLDCFSARTKRQHWALVPWETQLESRRDRLRRRYGVELLPYGSGTAPRGAALEFADRLRQEMPRGRRQRKPPPEPEQLQAVKLQNVGPFDELELELDRPTVLLGDNGSGKSSVLRAIGLALTGDSAGEDVARRMLKTTATRGEIELTTDRGRYRTRLLGDGPRVRVETDGLPPIQSSGWLTLGFPPLRGVSLSNPRGPDAVLADEPAPEDLLPLLSNGPDQRLDGLKQWVVNTAMSAEGLSRHSLRQRELLDRFFLILKDLTPGSDFEYEGVNRKSWEVDLASPDGPISFDLLSRGMTAMMGWVGILLQRLYEVYGDRDGPPEEQSALVLVDEIDVHLHPEWQHLVLPLIGKHFPNIQLVVTTHSPLIVGNVGEGAVQLLRRVDGDLVAERLGNEFAGWRSDQILTSAAFGLDSTRDAVTADMHREYRELMARGETPEVNEKSKQLFLELEGKMPAEQETPAARQGVALFRAWLHDYFEKQPSPERDAIIGEAELYLERLNSEHDK